MNASGSKTAVDEIRDRVDILTVVSDYVQLKKKGRYYVGLCPFHSEKTPSFTVTPEKGIFHCFGCGEGGDAFSFVQRIENVGFIEAAKTLAQRFNLPWNDLPENPHESEAREDILRIGRFAEAFFERILAGPKGEAARRYLEKRGVTAETAALFHLGYAPEGSTFFRFMKGKGVAPERLERAGLVLWGQNGYYDRFRDRVIFPIHDHRGRVVGFGGRTMGDGVPKYLNSPESPVFSKGRLLYGLDLAGESIRRQGRVFVVEGYMDAISLRQHGLSNVVASLGTAFTSDHARLLSRYAKEVFLCYDADRAGQSATLKGLDTLKQAGLDVRIVELPAGEDPDSFVRGSGLDEFLQRADNGPGVVEYRLSRVLDRPDLERPEAAAGAVQDVLPVLADIRDSVERDAYVQRLAASLRVSADSIYHELRQYLGRFRKAAQIMDTNRESSHTKSDVDKQTTAGYTPAAPPGYPRGAVLAEQELVKALVLQPELAEEVSDKVGSLAIEIHEQFVQFTREHHDPDDQVSLASWLGTIELSRAKYLRELVLRAEEEASSGKCFDVNGCIEKVLEGRIRQRIFQLEQEIVKCETRGVLEQGEGELSEILAELRGLYRQLEVKSSPLS